MARKPPAATATAVPAKLEIQYLAIAELTPYRQNPRTHSEGQVEQLAASMREFGFTNPVLIDETKTLIAGHGRVSAARKVGLTEVPAIILAGLSPAQRKALVIADNQLGMNAGWDLDVLRGELTALEDDGFDLDLVGFSETQLADIFATRVGLTDPDDVPDLSPFEITRVGEIWLLGAHRLICGDSTAAETVSALLGTTKPHLMVTDPPYGVEYDANWRNEAARSSKGMGNRAIGAGAVGKVENDDRIDWTEAWQLFPGDVAYVWHASYFTGEVQLSLHSAGFETRSSIIWAKQHAAIGRGHYHWQHEPCWYMVRKGATGHWSGDRKQTTVWNIDKPQRSETGHSTQKPVECMKLPIENNSKPDDAVYEPFSGSGTTIIAAEMTGRRCYAIEISPAYVDLAVRRWQQFTGAEAILESTGETFGSTEKERTQAGSGNGKRKAARG